MSSARDELIAELTAQAREQQIAYDRLHDAVAAYFGVNRTDIRCLDILDLRGTRTAGDLAAEMGLSTGAVTAMLDRLERTGYVRRVRDPADRRRVLVEASDLVRERGRVVYEPFAEQAGPRFATYSDAELVLLRDFLRTSNEFYAAQIDRVERLSR